MKKIPFLMLAVLLATACQKENSSPKTSDGTSHPASLSSQQSPSKTSADSTAQLDGTYVGNFSLVSNGQTTAVPVQFKIAGNQFHSVPGGNYYSVGDGTTTSVNSTLSFTNIDAFPGYIKSGSNIPLASVELSGTYDFSVKNDTLFLNKTVQGASYSYILNKQ